jgi:hypothetical protein
LKKRANNDMITQPPHGTALNTMHSDVKGKPVRRSFREKNRFSHILTALNEVTKRSQMSIYVNIRGGHHSRESMHSLVS